VLGGGGYTIRNVARCWSYETSLLLKTDISDELPFNDYLEYYGPDFRLHITPTNMENLNDPKYLEKMKIKLIENLRNLEGAPGVAFSEVPPDTYLGEEEESDPDVRISQQERDRRVEHEAELSDSEDEDDRRDYDAFDDEHS